jgi:hypothetical protein
VHFTLRLFHTNNSTVVDCVGTVRNGNDGELVRMFRSDALDESVLRTLLTAMPPGRSKLLVHNVLRTPQTDLSVLVLQQITNLTSPPFEADSPCAIRALLWKLGRTTI